MSDGSHSKYAVAEAVKPKAEAHYLKPLKGKIRRKRVVTFDIESKDGSSQRKGFTRPFLIGFYDGELFHAFKNDRRPANDAEPWNDAHLEKGGCIDKFCDFLFRTEPREEYQSKKANLYAHNGGKFDTLFIFAWLLRHQDEFAFQVTPTMSKIQMLIVWTIDKGKEGGTWTFLDSIGLVPGSLKKLASAFGVKGKVGMDLDADEVDNRWVEYNQQDCVALHDVLVRFHEVVEEEMHGEVKISTPATAMATYRRHYMPKFLHRNPHLSDCERQTPDPETGDVCMGCAHDWVRKSYYGGRTELFETHGTNLRYYDINSSYPFSMTFDMPVGRMVDLDAAGHKRWWRKYSETHVGFLDAEVFIPRDCKYPPLPHRLGGKLKFPTGYFRGTWDAEELALLFSPLVNGRIIKVHRSLWYEGQPVLRPFIDALYPLRLEEKRMKKEFGSRTLTPEEDEAYKKASAIAEVAKLLMNSLYGKWGMNPDRSSYIHVPPGKLPPFGSTPVGTFDGNDLESALWVAPQRVSASYIIPQIAAHITSLSRVVLWRIMAEVQRKGGRVYYCDTDSVICDVELAESHNLGGLKDEYPGSKIEGTFLRPKMYQLKLTDHEGKEKIKQAMKGVPQGTPEFFAENVVQISPSKPRTKKEKAIFDALDHARPRRAMSNDDIFAALSSSETVSQERLEQFRGMLRRGLKDRRYPSPSMRSVEKSIRSTYDKRELMADGSTRPWFIDELGHERIADGEAP